MITVLPRRSRKFTGWSAQITPSSEGSDTLATFFRTCGAVAARPRAACVRAAAPRSPAAARIARRRARQERPEAAELLRRAAGRLVLVRIGPGNPVLGPRLGIVPGNRRRQGVIVRPRGLIRILLASLQRQTTVRVAAPANHLHTVLARRQSVLQRPPGGNLFLLIIDEQIGLPPAAAPESPTPGRPARRRPPVRGEFEGGSGRRGIVRREPEP